MPTFEETIDKATAWDGHTDNRTTHGIVCKAINSDGTTLLAHASGTTHPSSPSSPAITPSNTFHLASCTKLLTSICALQCVERGLIGLDDPLDAYLPELCALPIITTATASTTNANANASNPDAPETPAFTYRPRSTPLTLRHLLTHTSGLAYAALHPVINAWRAANNGGAGPGAPDAAGDVVRDCSVPFVHEPGEGWTYGTGLDWAGKLVERLNGRPPAAGAGGGGDAGGGEDVTLEAYMSENIWAPLALRDSTFLLAARPDVEARLVATAEKKRGDGGGLQARAEGAAVVWPPRRPRDCLGGDGMYATAGDYVAVLRDLMREEPRLLKRETADLLFAPQLGMASEGARRDLEAAMDGMGVIWGGKVPEGVRLDYGLGGLLYVDGNPETGMRSGTLTWAGNGNTLWFANRGVDGGKGVAAFFATQLLPSGGPEISGLVRLFIQEVWKRAE